MADKERKIKEQSGVGRGSTGAETGGRESAGGGANAGYKPDPNDVVYEAQAERLDSERAFKDAMSKERLTFGEREEMGDLLQGLIRFEEVKASGVSRAQLEEADERQGELEARVANRIEPEKFSRLYGSAQRAARAEVAETRANAKAHDYNAAMDAAMERRERNGTL